jgi:hypothetical protein
MLSPPNFFSFPDPLLPQKPLISGINIHFLDINTNFNLMPESTKADMITPHEHFSFLRTSVNFEMIPYGQLILGDSFVEKGYPEYTYFKWNTLVLLSPMYKLFLVIVGNLNRIKKMNFLK